MATCWAWLRSGAPLAGVPHWQSHWVIVCPSTRPTAAVCAQRVVPRLDEAGVSLLAQLLAFDPARRISARRALQHPYFAELRTAEAAPRAAETLLPNPATSCSPGAAAALAPAAPAATPPNAEAPRGSCHGSCQSDAHGARLEAGLCDGGSCAGLQGDAGRVRAWEGEPSGDVHMAGSSPDGVPAGGARAPNAKPIPAPRGRHAAPLSLLCTEPPEAAAGSRGAGFVPGGLRPCTWAGCPPARTRACARAAAGSCAAPRRGGRWRRCRRRRRRSAQTAAPAPWVARPARAIGWDYALQTGARGCGGLAETP